jgi:LysR family transcriptional regulator, transcriptional activator of nhaA
MRTLNFHHLRYFWMIASTGSMTAAAERLNVSVSSLSIQLKELEQRIGQPLFTRESRKLILTEAGRLVFDHAAIIFQTADELTRAIGKGDKNRTQAIHVGSVATLSRNFQIEFLAPILNRHDVEIELRSGSMTELLAGLRDHTLDLVLSNLPAPHDAETGWHSTLVHQQAVSLISQPVKGDKRLRFPQSLKTQPIMLPSSRSNVRVAFDLAMAQAGIEPMIIAEVDDMSMLRLLAGTRDGLTLVPPVVVRQELDRGTLVERCRIPDIQERFYAITRDRRFPNPLVKELLAYKPKPAAPTKKRV